MNIVFNGTRFEDFTNSVGNTKRKADFTEKQIEYTDNEFRSQIRYLATSDTPNELVIDSFTLGNNLGL